MIGSSLCSWPATLFSTFFFPFFFSPRPSLIAGKTLKPGSWKKVENDTGRGLFVQCERFWLGSRRRDPAQKCIYSAFFLTFGWRSFGSGRMCTRSGTSSVEYFLFIYLFYSPLLICRELSSNCRMVGSETDACWGFSVLEQWQDCGSLWGNGSGKGYGMMWLKWGGGKFEFGLNKLCGEKRACAVQGSSFSEINAPRYKRSHGDGEAPYFSEA